ncbi:MAG: hypothetical protein RIT81_33290 [Deltaproteobacteria bacterium]
MRYLVLAVLLAGCAATRASHEQLLARASFDLECDASALEVVQIDDKTRGVKGCGQRATYVSTCETGANRYGTYQHDCTWVMNATNGKPTVAK